jgi:hypothetical protein
MTAKQMTTNDSEANDNLMTAKQMTTNDNEANDSK